MNEQFDNGERVAVQATDRTENTRYLPSGGRGPLLLRQVRMNGEATHEVVVDDADAALRLADALERWARPPAFVAVPARELPQPGETVYCGFRDGPRKPVEARVEERVHGLEGVTVYVREVGGIVPRRETVRYVVRDDRWIGADGCHVGPSTFALFRRNP